MQETMQIFENREFGQIRTLTINGEPWFFGNDVAAILGYERPRKAVLDHVDAEDRDGVPIQDSIGRMQNTPIINESGLYSLMLKSKLPTAKKFKRWVTSEVLPSIRKHGAYINEDVLRRMQEDSEFTAELLRNLTAEQQRSNALVCRVAQLTPKAQYHDIILQCPDAVQASIIAKDYGMTAIAFNKMLNRLRVQFKIGKTWLLYKDYQGFGYTVTNTYTKNGVTSFIHTCWTPKGRHWLYELLKSFNVLPEVERAGQMNLNDIGA